MRATFISQCEKKALAKTRRVLDAFADRIGDRVWQTAITAEGVNAVKKLLRKTASKNTAVSCYLVRGHKQSELAWIVGNRQKFNEQGIVPINSTKSDIINTQWENDWRYMPLIKSLAALAGLFHDWGKASDFFQEKLKKNSLDGDPVRHEWVSVVLLRAVVGNDSDDRWLQRLIDGNFNEKDILENLQIEKDHPLENLPNAAKLIVWLMLAHHRLPLVLKKDNDYRDAKAETLDYLLGRITQGWGYENGQDNLDKCFEFTQGLPFKSLPWLRQLRKWAAKIKNSLPLLEKALADGSWRVVLYYARLSLMLGDHKYSSQDSDEKWRSNYNPIANTYRSDDSQNKKGSFKQKLDEHLVGVAKTALRTAALLPMFEKELQSARDIKELAKPSNAGFRWQDKAVNEIKVWRQSLKDKERQYGFFAVNMASTGCGKTFANAKVMRALSPDGESLRYVLALGLRTLTLQTGDEYRERIGLDNSELAVLIGSQAVMDLHKQDKKHHVQEEIQVMGSESLEELLDDGVIDYECAIPEGVLTTLLRGEKDRKFLYSSVLACTVDHLIAATETKRGGRYILPSLRLMSSDLVIDEIDDFSGKDLIAIGRLIHLAGMLGRKVMISSATIPPDLAEGYFNVYCEGWRLFAKTREVSMNVASAWIDEFGTQVVTISESNTRQAAEETYRNEHDGFIKKRAAKLKKEVVRRKAEIINCEDILAENNSDEESIKQLYFQHIQEAVIQKHSKHFTIDPYTQKKVSFGLVRVANVNPCIALTKYLIATEWPDNIDIKVMPYHSQQVLLMRSEQEKHLDAVLKCKDRKKSLSHLVVREHLNNSKSNNVIFILVATPVEEVGRDHDFDWAVVEPSSFRSIIQLAGRVLRHRNQEIKEPNIALMQYNLRALKKGDTVAFCCPGYEAEGKYKLGTHDLTKLVDEKSLQGRVDALPRILRNKELKAKESLIDLEHFAISELLSKYDGCGPETMQGWLTQCWWLTALPQYLNPFREGRPHVMLYLVPKEGGFVFMEKDDKGQASECEKTKGIEQCEESGLSVDRLWLQRDYLQLLEICAEQQEISPYIAALRYGEISFYHKDQQRHVYSPQFGVWVK